MKKNIFFIILLFFVLLLVYQHTFKYDLIWDSKSFVEEGALLTGDYNVSSAFKFGYIKGQFGYNKESFYYRPLVHISFMLEKKLWGLKSNTLRLINLFIFFCSIFVLFLFFRNLSISKPFPYVSTIIFSFLPINVDNIVWVVSRGDLLLLFWGSLCLLFFHKYSESKKSIFFLLSSLFFLLGIFSKETFLVFLPVLFFYNLFSKKKTLIIYHIVNLFSVFFFFLVKHKILGLSSLKMYLASNIVDNFRRLLFVTGYYFRVIIFPLNLKIFNFVREIGGFKYIFFGILGVLFFIYIIKVCFKDQRYILPVTLTIFFLVPFIALSFSGLWPFRLSSRYMMMSSLGVVMIFSIFINRFKTKTQYLIVFILILLFIPNIMVNSSSYKNESIFWRNALDYHPESGEILFMLAHNSFQNDEKIVADYYVKKALKIPLSSETALHISILKAKIEYHKANYPAALEWINKIKSTFTLKPEMKYHIESLIADVQMSTGNKTITEKLLKNLLKNYSGKREVYKKIYNFYIGKIMWEKAGKIEKKIEHEFPGSLVDTNKIKQRFETFSLDKKIAFYSHYKNYESAIELLNSKKKNKINYKLKLIELYYKSGKSNIAEQSVKKLLKNKGKNYQVLNTMGFFYLKKFNRIKESLNYFKKSIKVKNDQPQLKEFINFLETKL